VVRAHDVLQPGRVDPLPVIRDPDARLGLGHALHANDDLQARSLLEGGQGKRAANLESARSSVHMAQAPIAGASASARKRLLACGAPAPAARLDGSTAPGRSPPRTSRPA